jgi:hypothetical protein
MIHETTFLLKDKLFHAVPSLLTLEVGERIKIFEERFVIEGKETIIDFCSIDFQYFLVLERDVSSNILLENGKRILILEEKSTTPKKEKWNALL